MIKNKELVLKQDKCIMLLISQRPRLKALETRISGKDNDISLPI